MSLNANVIILAIGNEFGDSPIFNDLSSSGTTQLYYSSASIKSLYSVLKDKEWI